MSADAMARFLSLAALDPEQAAKYHVLGTPEATLDDENLVCRPPGPDVVDTFPGLSVNEKTILKSKNLQHILRYLKGNVRKPKPVPDDETGGG